MRKLMLNGVLPSEAARSAINQEVSPANLVQDGPDLKPKADVKQVTPDNVIAIDGPKAIIRSLNRATSNLDATGCDQIISNSVKAHGVVWTWEQVLLPVLISVGEKWAETGEGVEQEHLLSESIIGQFRSLTLQVTQPENARPVLLACAPHELHTIPIFAIAAALAEQNIASRILGARMPAQALANAVKKLGPSAIVVWSQTLGTADTSIWDLVEPMRPGHLRICAGPGWQEALPADVTKPNDFTSTLVALAAASGR
jgi:methanogenic corrinoid protein MtbC1